jgi:uncharacterized protein (DUF488 family)
VGETFLLQRTGCPPPGTGVSSGAPLTVWTIGHSSRTIDEFLALLRSQGIERIADIRRFPGSRAHPHFNPEPLAASLEATGIEYLPFPDLGGRRKASTTSVNTVWRNPSFRGYADYMGTPAFGEALDRFLGVARECRTALMCSEAVWWRCHRSMVADALKAGGIRVLHIMDGPKSVEHPYTSAARIVDGVLLYGDGPV